MKNAGQVEIPEARPALIARNIYDIVADAQSGVRHTEVAPHPQQQSEERAKREQVAGKPAHRWRDSRSTIVKFRAEKLGEFAVASVVIVGAVTVNHVGDMLMVRQNQPNGVHLGSAVDVMDGTVNPSVTLMLNPTGRAARISYGDDLKRHATT